MEQQQAEPSLPEASGSVQSGEEKTVEEELHKQTEGLVPTQPSFSATISPGDSVKHVEPKMEM
jgi:hypothetical protein